MICCYVNLTFSFQSRVLINTVFLQKKHKMSVLVFMIWCYHEKLFHFLRWAKSIMTYKTYSWKYCQNFVSNIKILNWDTVKLRKLFFVHCTAVILFNQEVKLLTLCELRQMVIIFGLGFNVQKALLNLAEIKTFNFMRFSSQHKIHKTRHNFSKF